MLNVPHGFRAAVALGAAAFSVALGVAPPRLAAEPVAPVAPVAIDETGSLPGRRATSLGVFTGLVGFSDQVEIGNSYYDDQVPGLGLLVGLRGAAQLAAWAGGRLDGEGEARIAVARTDAGGARESATASVLGWRAHALVALLTDEPVHPLLFAGLGGETLVGGSPFMSVPDTDLVLYGGAGGELAVGRRGALRADLRLEMMAGRDGGAAAAFEASVGYALRFGGPGARIGRIQIAARPAPVRAPAPAFAHVDPPAPVDGDRDGIAGEADRCPDEPEDVDQTRDDDGCPDPDDDGDGWADAHDSCPREPERVNGFADADGCPDEVPADLAAHTGELKGVRFAPGTVRLDRRSRPVLDQLTAVLLRYPDVRVQLTAHTDDTGEPAREQELSAQQAAYVKWYLVDKGVDDRRIDAVGRGAERMKYDHATRAGRAANWRIELDLVSGQTAQPDGGEPRRDGPDPVFLPGAAAGARPTPTS